MNYSLGIDASRWDLPLDWSQLKTGGVEFTILKASQGCALRDPRFATNLQGAQAAGLICAAYHWCDPTGDDRQQIDNFLTAIEGKPLAFLAVDVEQYWQEWNEWGSRRVTRFIRPERISQSALSIATAIKARCRLPVLIYTRASFVRDYASPMSAWLPQWDLWLAHYPYASGRVTCNWEQLRGFFPKISGPSMPPGCRSWRFWQFSADKFVLPGAHSPLDLNLFNGSLDDLRTWCRQDPIEPSMKTLKPAEMLRRLWLAHPDIHPKMEEEPH